MMKEARGTNRSTMNKQRIGALKHFERRIDIDIYICVCGNLAWSCRADKAATELDAWSTAVGKERDTAP